MLKASSFVFIAVALVVSGFFAPQQAFAAANVTPASEGTNISIDTTAPPIGTGVYTELSGPAIAELVAGDISAGTHTITLPSGWEFNTGSNITISKFGGNIVLGSTSVTPTQPSFSFVVTSQSTSGSILGFSGLKVRPTGFAPSTGKMTHSGAAIAGVTDGVEGTNFGTLSTVPGTVAKLLFTTQPGNAVYGSTLSTAPVVKTQDQFGNNSINGLVAPKMVSLELTGTGVLQGTVSLNIGTGGGTPGTVTFTDLKVGGVDATGTKGLTASAGTLTDAVSETFVISQKFLTATLTADNKEYDGDADANITGVELDGVVDDDVVGTDFSGATATFENENAANGKAVSATGITLPDEDDALVFEYAKVNTASCDNAPYPTANTNTFNTKGIVGGSAYAWLSSGPPGPCGNETFDANHMSLANWKSTGTAGIDGTTQVFRIEIEIDNWILQSSADISNIKINDVAYAGPMKLTATEGATAEWVGGVAHLETTGEVNTGKEARIVIQASDAGITTLNNLNTISWDVAGITGYLPHADVIVNIGNYTYNGTAAGTADITAKPITVTPTAGQTKIYGQDDPIFAYTFTPALIDGSFTGALGRATGDNVGTYAYTIGSLSAGSNYTLTLVPGTFEITKRTLNVTATGVNKIYDANTTATVTLSDDRVFGDEITLGYTAVFSDNKNVDLNKPVSVTGISITGGADMGNYTLNGVTTAATTANIIAKPLTVSFTTDVNKTYNGSATADITGRTLAGIISPEVVDVTGGSATFADKHIGLAKTVTATGFALTGVDSGNYSIGTINTTTGNVNPRPITVTAVTDSKIYNGTTGSGGTPVVTSTFSPPVAAVDTASFIQTYDNKNADTVKTLTPSGTVDDDNSGLNYSYNFVTNTTGVITEKSINVTAQTDTKTYDGTTSSSVVPVVDPLETLDTVGTPPTQVYDTKNVGTTKTLTPGGLVINDGNSGLNYTIVPVVNNTGVINAKGLTVSGATTNSKIYNGDATATVNFGLATLVGKIAGEEALVSLNPTDYSATFNNKNVAIGKTVTISGLALAGTGAGNYSLTQPVLNDGVITERTLVVTADGTTKVYDGTDDATEIVELSDDRILEDVLTLGYTATFEGPNGKNVGTDKPVSVTGIAIIGGADADNYTLGNTETDTTADITPATLTATITASDRIYNGTDDATITGYAHDALGGDVVELSGGTATFNNANVGDNKPVTAEGIIHSGVDALNYSYNSMATGNADITPLGISGSFTADNKIYNGNTVATILTRSLTGVLSGDIGNVTLTGGTAEFANPNVADGITVTASGMTLNGSAAGNYSLTNVGTTITNITKAPLTITADNKNKVYGDGNPVLTASYAGFVGGENASVLDTSVSLSTTAVGASSVGAYSITASGAADINYNISFFSGTLTVTPAPLTITADAKSKTYGDVDPGLTYLITSGSLINEDILTGLLSRVTGENIGAYAITSTLAHPNYTITFVSADLTINKKPITVTAVTNTKTYDGNPSAAGIPTFTGSLVGTDTANFAETYDNKNVGPGKMLTPSGIVNDGNSGLNYSYTFVTDTTGVITPLGITVTPTAGQTKIYGQDDPIFAYTFTPALIDGSFTGALGRVSGTNVGTYNYELGSLTAGGNYLLTLGGTETFGITKATPVITWESLANIVYGTALSGTQLNATADVAGAFVYTPTTGTVLNAGAGQTLSVTFTPTDTLNYESVTQDVLITVTPAPLTVTADDKSKEYGTANPPLTANYVGFVNGENKSVLDTPVSLSTTANDTSPAGDYDIDALGATDVNYNITYANGTLTVADTVAPTLISHTPSFNALNISPTTAIVVTFSEAVDVESDNVSFSPEISDGFTIINSGTSVVTITPNDPLEDNTTYTITLNGVADVNGLALPTYSNIKFTTATNYSIDLNANASGWNLISLPVVPSNAAIATVLGSAVDDIDAVWTYDPTNPNAVNGWLVFVPGNPEGTNNLTLMTTGFGYWVSVTDDANLSGSGTLLIAGPTPPPSRSLQTGWNLIGYYQLPNEDNSTPVSAFASIGAPGVGYNGLWGFDNTTGFFNSVTTINPGDAFWISLPGVKTYTPSNIGDDE